MDSPKYPTKDQLQTLNDASQITNTSTHFNTINTDTIQISLMIPEYGVAILDLQY